MARPMVAAAVVVVLVVAAAAAGILLSQPWRTTPTTTTTTTTMGTTTGTTTTGAGPRATTRERLRQALVQLSTVKDDDRELILMWTTAKETFTDRHWLVLHTYLHHHPAFRVTVYATELPLDFFTPLSRWGYAIRVARIDDALLAELREACPGKRWVDRLDEWRHGPYFYSHLTDYLRFCLLARLGGVYSDFDAYLLQPLDPALPDFIGKDVGHPVRGSCDWCLEDGHHYLAPGVMGAGAPQAPLLLTALQLAFDGEYRPHVFNAVGPQAVTAAYKALPAAALATVHVFEPTAFYPLPYWRAHEWLKPENGSAAALTPDEAADVRLEQLARQSVSLHLFGHMTGRLPIEPGSVAARLGTRFHVVAEPAANTHAHDGNDAAPLYTVHGPAYAAVVHDHTTLRAWRIVPAAHASPSQHLHIEVTVQGAFRLGSLRSTDPLSSIVVVNATRLCTTVSTVAEANLWLGAVALSGGTDGTDGKDGAGADRHNEAGDVGHLAIRVHLRLPAPAHASPDSVPTAACALGEEEEEEDEAVAHMAVPVYDVPRLVTVMVKTTGRIAKVFELLQSLRVRYPSVTVIAADDGEHAGHSRNLARDPHFAYLALPFDVGLSAGRNAMLDHVGTPYVLTLDDDFTLDGASVIEALLHTVAAGHADLAAGRNPVDEDRYGFEFTGLLEVNNRTTLALVPGHRGRVGGDDGNVSTCRRVDIVPNLFLARTARLRTLRWDPALKLGEHEDFFLRAQRAGWIVAACPAVAFVHGGSQSWFTLTETSSAYDRMRSRIHQFWELALRKHGLTRLVSFGTVVLDLAGPAPVAEVVAGEVLPSAFTVYWSPSPWATKYELVVQMHGQPAPARAGAVDSTARDAVSGVRRTYDACPVQIIDVSPATAYTVTVYALIAHIRERVGRTITVQTPPALQGWGLLRNGGFEHGDAHWQRALGTVFHTSNDVMLGGRVSGRLQVHASAYLSSSPAVMRIEQHIPITAKARRFIVGAWSSIENLFGDATSITYRIEAIAHCGDGGTIAGHADYALSVPGWQFRSFSIELAPDADVRVLVVRCVLGGHRGAVYFDNVTVVDEL